MIKSEKNLDFKEEFHEPAFGIYRKNESPAGGRI